MIHADFEYAKQFIVEIPQENRRLVLVFFDHFDALTTEALGSFYLQERAVDAEAALRHGRVLLAFAKKMGLSLEPPQEMTEDQRVKDERAREAIERSKRARQRQGTIEVLVFLTAIAAFIAGLFWLMWGGGLSTLFGLLFPAPPHTSVTASLKNEGIVLIGHTAIISAEGEGMPCPGTSTGADAMVTALSAGDKAGAARAVINSGGFVLHRGWQVRAVDTSGAFDSISEYRVESGPHSGDACWLPTDIKIFKDIH